MFGKKKNKISPEVQSMIDRTIRAHFVQLNRKLEGVGVRQSNLKGKVTNLDNSVSKLIMMYEDAEYRIRHLEEYLKVEFVEEEVREYRKITKTKK